MSNTEDRQEDSSVYELGYLVLPSIPEDNLPQVVDSIKKAVTEAGGRELDGEAPHKRALAYSMSKVVGSRKYVVGDAYIGWLKFEIEPSKAEEVKSRVERLEEIIRFLLIRAPRETHFTFAQALEAQRAKEAAEQAPEEKAGEVEVEAPASREDVVE